MSTVGHLERATQNRVIALFRNELKYRYLGDWTDRAGNSNIDEKLLTEWLTKRGITPPQISVALHKLRTEADNHNRGLYGNNQAVYGLLRYGVPVKTDVGQPTETVHLIDWQTATANDFAIDLQRYLADEPVQACPPSAGYRLRKFVRRNKGAVLALAAIFLLLITGIAAWPVMSMLIAVIRMIRNY